MNLIKGYPSYRINHDAAYRVPPGWNLLVCAILDELETMRADKIVGDDFKVKEVGVEEGALVLTLQGTYRPELVSALLANYAERSKRICAECGYEGLRDFVNRRPTCGACKTLKKRGAD